MHRKVLWLVAAVFSILAACAARRPVQAPVGVAASGGYVENETCLSCHQAEGEKWKRSHHFHAMSAATDATVLGDFNGATFTARGLTTRFFRRNGAFWVRTDGRAGELQVQYCMGDGPLQQYVVALPGGRLQCLTVAWDSQTRRWVQLSPGQDAAGTGDMRQQDGLVAPAGRRLSRSASRTQNWNSMCASCHTTHLDKRYDEVTDTYATTWSEINVSCQACHGPGARHVVWARTEGRDPRHDGFVPLRSRSAADEVDVCAACHSRRSQLTATPDPNRPLLANYLPETLSPGLYYADGQPLAETYQYGSYRQSRMYQSGVRCTDCHDAHSDGLKAEGNAVCTQCHQYFAHERFPSAAGWFDTEHHHHHRKDMLCVSCHMPEAGLRRDHSFRIPRPDLTVSLGVPNACNQCHRARTASWAAAAVKRWYGHPPTRHYGTILALGRAGGAGWEQALAGLVRSPNDPAIVRATALDLLQNGGPASLEARLQATRDLDPVVRVAAVDSLLQTPDSVRLETVASLLRDPVKAVRISAVLVLSNIPPTRFGPFQKQAYDAAAAEFVAAQSTSLDLPGARLNLALFYENSGRTDLAEQHDVQALRIDPDFTPARANLAQLYSMLGRHADAERTLREGVSRLPDQGQLWYMLGLVLAEEKQMGPAVAALATASRLLPSNGRVQYNYGVALQQVGRGREAETVLLQAWRLEPRDVSIMQALVASYVQQGRWPVALRWAERLQRLRPADPQTEVSVAELRRRARHRPH